MLSGGYSTKVALVKICYLVQLILQVFCYGMSPFLNYNEEYIEISLSSEHLLILSLGAS